jgi:hypothetical protein
VLLSRLDVDVHEPGVLYGVGTERLMRLDVHERMHSRRDGMRAGCGADVRDPVQWVLGVGHHDDLRSPRGLYGQGGHCDVRLHLEPMHAGGIRL